MKSDILHKDQAPKKDLFLLSFLFNSKPKLRQIAAFLLVFSFHFDVFFLFIRLFSFLTFLPNDCFTHYFSCCSRRKCWFGKPSYSFVLVQFSFLPSSCPFLHLSISFLSTMSDFLHATVDVDVCLVTIQKRRKKKNIAKITVRGENSHDHEIN